MPLDVPAPPWCPSRRARRCSAPELADFLRRAAGHRPVLRPDAAGHARARTCPALRFLLVSGEAVPAGPGRPLAPARPPVPQRLRPHRGHRDRDLDGGAPGRPVTLGVPLPTYSAVILDPDSDRGPAAGRAGRDRHRGARAGPRLREPRRPDRARPSSPTSSGSRTTRRRGSTAPATSAGSTPTARSSTTAGSTPRSRSAATGSSWPRSSRSCCRCPGSRQAVVTTYEPAPGVVELVGYYSPAPGRRRSTRASCTQRCGAGCPPYMVPAYLEQLERDPDAARATRPTARACPPPTGRRAEGTGGGRRARRPPSTETGPGRRAGRGPRRRPGLGRQPLLRRPRRQLACC